MFFLGRLGTAIGLNLTKLGLTRNKLRAMRLLSACFVHAIFALHANEVPHALSVRSLRARERTSNPVYAPNP